jgi:hypothetical protein
MQKQGSKKGEIAWEQSLFPCFLVKNVLKADKPVFSLPPSSEEGT